MFRPRFFHFVIKLKLVLFLLAYSSILLILQSSVCFARDYTSQYGEELDHVPFEVRYLFRKSNGIEWEDVDFETREEFLDMWVAYKRKEKREVRKKEREKRKRERTKIIQKRKIDRARKNAERAARRREREKARRERERKKIFRDKVRAAKKKMRDMRREFEKARRRKR